MAKMTLFFDKTVVKLSEIAQIEQDTSTTLTRRQDKDGTYRVSLDGEWIEIVNEDLTKL